MNREPILLYFFRLLIGIGLFAMMLMLYWSSNLMEQDLKGIKYELKSVREQLNELRSDLSDSVVRGQNPFNNAQQNSRFDRMKNGFELESDYERTLISSKHPNIYSEDPFYSKILPSLLPKGFVPRGTRHDATYGRPDNIHPFSNWSSVSSWQGMCSISVGGGHFGKYETYGPEMAFKLEERINPETNTPEFWVHLRDNVYWQPLNPNHFPEGFELAPQFLKKHKVTAHDFKFWFDAVMNPFNQTGSAVSLRNYIGDIEDFRVLDDYTFVVRWKTEEVVDSDGKTEQRVKYIAKGWTGALQPLARWVYQYFPDGSKIIEDDSDSESYRNSSVWAQNFSDHWAKNVIVSCGAWIFDGMTDREIRFVRNPDYFESNAVLVGSLIQEFKESPETIWQDFRAGKIDTYGLNPQQLVELEEFMQSEQYAKQKEEGMGIKRLDYLSRVYSYIGWNQARPLFESKKVRKAMTLAIDRNRIINQILNGLGVQITGPFFKNSPSNDSSIEPIAYNPSEARQLLEEEGWYDSDGDGILDKEINGKRIPFSFSLTYFVKNPTTKGVVEYIATAFNEIGIDCQLHGVDHADLSSTFENKDFDAIALGWALGSPPEEPRQLWHSSGAKEKGSSNAVGFASDEADSIIAELQYEYDAEKRRALYHRLHAIIHDEQPYTFLYTPKSILLYREYVQNVFIPSERQDIIPGADIAEPSSSIFWLQSQN